MKIIKLVIPLFILPFMDLQSRESKEYDNDVNYDEAKIPHYDLPKLLVTPEGQKITSIKEWGVL